MPAAPFPNAAPKPALIAVDWGTSQLRARLVDGSGAVLAETGSAEGIGQVSGNHEEIFTRLVAAWPPVPAILSGMVGSRQGWREVAYVACPATPAALAAAIVPFTTAPGRRIAIVPGVVFPAPARDGDVMRGEETQMIGLIDRVPGFAGTVILPGTHSKWARLEGGAITGFQTFMTGELFALLARQSFLRHSVAESDADIADAPGFALGVARTAGDGLPFLAGLFSVRTRNLLHDADRADNRAYLSGLVIGGEIAAARATGLATGALRIVGARALARAYRKALAIVGIAAETLDGDPLALDGQIHLARSIGFLRSIA